MTLGICETERDEGVEDENKIIKVIFFFDEMRAIQETTIPLFGVRREVKGASTDFAFVDFGVCNF